MKKEKKVYSFATRLSQWVMLVLFGAVYHDVRISLLYLLRHWYGSFGDRSKHDQEQYEKCRA